MSKSLEAAALMIAKEVVDNGPMELRDLFSLATSSTSPECVLQLTESPMITLAKGDTLVHIQPTAIAFWEKLGSGPKGGKKDVTAYTLFQEVDKSHRSSVANWLRNLSSE
ncbi:hypothetical protein PLEOSDRAFT_160721 [Pleurotus ostreatus PC15]|uniref:Uncharacterized protein n=1 Tax=Pleurotus ostreatus (strain PC15) TaxID=1137138 RepID=A0A067NE41_PLEO1|nr:hypothetical protein PLEOSDRAFT_160721 [Pleurotus ostreatus PC15]